MFKITGRLIETAFKASKQVQHYGSAAAEWKKLWLPLNKRMSSKQRDENGVTERSM